MFPPENGDSHARKQMRVKTKSYNLSIKNELLSHFRWNLQKMCLCFIHDRNATVASIGFKQWDFLV